MGEPAVGELASVSSLGYQCHLRESCKNERGSTFKRSNTVSCAQAALGHSSKGSLPILLCPASCKPRSQELRPRQSWVRCTCLPSQHLGGRRKIAVSTRLAWARVRPWLTDFISESYLGYHNCNQTQPDLLLFKFPKIGLFHPTGKLFFKQTGKHFQMTLGSP